MGAGGELVGGAVAAAAVGEQAVVAVVDLTRVIPWDCPWPGCGEYLEKGVSQKYVNSHMRQHRASLNEEQGWIAKREAARAKKRQARGGSFQKKMNKRKDMKAQQRKQEKGNTGGKDKGAGCNGNGKGARNKAHHN